MTDSPVLISAEALEKRRQAIRGSADLRAIEARLRADLDQVLAHPLHVPEQKALLSRWGAACRDDEAALAFDPFSPDRQRCTRCGRLWDTEQSRRWWIYWYQLWLAERVLVMALHAGDGGPYEKRAIETLGLIAERYQGYPNADNVLGPSRPFFSTYLESIWILHLTSAVSLLHQLGALSSSLKSRLVTSVFKPSSQLIADFPEGRSNRQAWNAAALFALGRALGDDAMTREASHGDNGILASLRGGLLDDGPWYEGENYHWFALRGLTWGAHLLHTAGEVDLWRDEGRPAALFTSAFRAPVLTALPDFTFPARRDSKFGVSLRQRRMAELWEDVHGHTGTRAPEYASLLRFVYDETIPATDESLGLITDVERPDELAGGLRRSQLGWKGLLYAAPELPDAPADAWKPGSAHLEATGLAVFRRDEGATYLSLDYGESGGGHGHPDRLNLTLVAKDVPWLLDFGTGSYVAPSLAWYRSTLAHNAPLVDGQSQSPANGHCVAHDEQGEYGWICAVLPDGSAYDGATIQRTVVVTPGYILDVVQMGSGVGERQLAVPWHGLGRPVVDDAGLTFTRSSIADHPSPSLRVLLGARQPFQVLVQKGPGPAAADGAGELEYAIAFANGEGVTLASCIDLGAGLEELECVDDDFILRFPDGSVHAHRATDDGWMIELERGDPVELGGLRPEPEPGAGNRESGIGVPGDRFSIGGAGIIDHRSSIIAFAATIPRARTEAPTLTLDRPEQFRRAEDPWGGPDDFSARAWLWHDGESVHLVAEVTGAALFRPGETPNPEWENENPDIHGAGLQLYLEAAGLYGWLIVPDDHDHGRLRIAGVRGTDGEAAMITVGGWDEMPGGYRVTCTITIPEDLAGDIGLDLLVNQAREGRERRVGQLVWSGAQGGRLYLAGDRAPNVPLPRVKLE